MSEESPIVHRVANIMRERMSADVSAAVDAKGRARAIAALQGASSRHVPWGRVAFAMAALLVVAGLAFRGAKTSYTVESSASQVGSIAASEGSLLLFSDGSRLHLEPGATGHVERTRFRGADFGLGEGTLEAEVVHRAFTEWTVRAGPFTVRVTGTRFSISWSEKRRLFALRLHEGSVEVQGDLLAGGRKISRGERLVIDLTTGKVLVDHELVLPVGNLATPGLTTVEGAGAPSESRPAEASAEAAAKNGEPRASDAPRSGGATDQVGWPDRVASGDFRGVVDHARSQGIDTVLARAPTADLLALADAARYLGDRALSGRVLAAQRRRFPGTERSAMAAFLLGRLAEDSGDTRGALSWYDRYLVEQPRGTFTEEALGRKMIALERANPEQARLVARDYLVRFPHGSSAHVAQKLVAQH